MAEADNDRATDSLGVAKEDILRTTEGTTQRVVRPESRSDLRMLRDMTNETSRDALDNQSRQQSVSAAFSKVWITLIASAVSLSLLRFSSPERLGVCIGAAVSVIITMVFALSFLNRTRILSKQLRRLESEFDANPFASPQDEHRKSD